MNFSNSTKLILKLLSIQQNYTIPIQERNDSLALLQYYNRLQEIKILHMLTNIGERINKSHFWDPLPLHVGATYDFVGHIVSKFPIQIQFHVIIIIILFPLPRTLSF